MLTGRNVRLPNDPNLLISSCLDLSWYMLKYVVAVIMDARLV